MDIVQLKKEIKTKYFDYQRLKVALGEDSHERRSIGRLIETGMIIRVKKGLYLWSEDVDPRPYSREVLANLVYGPSYVSLEYALSYHNLIPERVEEVTSVTPKRCKRYETPVGVFLYEYLNPRTYTVGVHIVVVSPTESFLIASKEKAILDMLALRERARMSTQPEEVFAYLTDDLRIDEDGILSLSRPMLAQLAQHYNSRFVRDFGQALGQQLRE